MILISTTLALVSAGSMVALNSPAWADLFAAVFIISAFVAICASESSPHSN
jgi:hypothetical protein